MSQTYKIIYFNHNSVYEIYSKEVYQSDMYGFIVVEDLVFGKNTSLVVDPSEEKLKTEFGPNSRTENLFLCLFQIFQLLPEY